jgi:hypothetical protein
LVRNLVSSVTDIEIKYPGYGEPVKNLSVTKVLLFNKGREAIRKSDLAPHDSLKIATAEGVVILGVAIVYYDRATGIAVRRTNDRKEAPIAFDYLDHRQGAVIEIIHTGSTPFDVKVQGTVINGGQARHLRIAPTEWWATIRWSLAMIAGPALMLLIISNPTQREFLWGSLPVPTFLVLYFGFFGTFRRAPLPFGRYKKFKAFWD